MLFFMAFLVWNSLEHQKTYYHDKRYKIAESHIKKLVTKVIITVKHVKCKIMQKKDIKVILKHFD